MAAMKKTEEYGFLKEVDSIALQQSLRHLDMAFQNFFKQLKTGFPRFKSKKQNKNSYSTVCINGNITISNGYLKLPKIGQVRLKKHRIIQEEYGSVSNCQKGKNMKQNRKRKETAGMNFQKVKSCFLFLVLHRPLCYNKTAYFELKGEFLS